MLRRSDHEPRGAAFQFVEIVRRALTEPTYLIATNAGALFGGHADVLFASHHWPTWGHDHIVEYLSLQRDLYAYLHDQITQVDTQITEIDQRGNGIPVTGGHRAKAVLVVEVDGE